MFGLPKTRVALFGAGFIAPVHVRALRRCRWIEIAGVHDVDPERTERFARQHRIPALVDDPETWLRPDSVDAVHLIVPPDRHAALARRCLEAGVHVLVEKPLALRAAEASELGRLADAAGKRLGVNHNMVFHPAVARLRRHLDAGRLGRLEHLSVTHNVPLRQLVTGDVGHFMFRTEENILLEQAVHPFSIVQKLLGRCVSVRAAVHRRDLPNGRPFLDHWQLAIECERGTADVRLAFGRDFPEQSVHAIGTDGAARLDLVRDTYVRVGKTRWMDAFDAAANGLRAGTGLAAQGAASALNYVLSTAHLRGTTDPYLVGMERSLVAFHEALRDFRHHPGDASEAAEVLEYCERSAEAAGIRLAPGEASELAPASTPAPAPEPTPASTPEPGSMPVSDPRPGEIAVTGGTGFVGRYVVRQLLEADRPVTLLVRDPGKLRTELRDDRIRIVRGDASDPDALERAFRGAEAVLHLATCMSDDPDPAVVERAMAEATRRVADASTRAGVRRLVFTSSTSALWLGDDGSIDGACGTDPAPEKRSSYSRGKIASEKALADVAARGASPGGSAPEIVIVRPAVVLGEGGPAEHGGIGLWVRDNHCVGWGLGRHPLPLVLARDVASALIAAADRPEAAGSAYNLAGPVDLTAEQYVGELRRATGRDYRFHPTPLAVTQAIEVFKWLVKIAVGRRGVPFPSYRDFRSRSLRTRLDTSDAERELGWTPEADRETFLDEAIRIHAPRRPASPPTDPPGSTAPPPTRAVAIEGST